jgi:flagellar basal-body rod protein FlgG
MIRSLYTGTTGMNAQQLNIDVIANNLANVSTTGFKRSIPSFEDLLYETIKVPGSQTSSDTQTPTGILVGMGVGTGSVEKVFSQGPLTQTDNPLDIAIQGSGFFQIQLPNGTTAYTRAGNFQTDSNGRVTTADGYLLLPAITIPQGANQITISNTGIVSAILAGETASTQLGTIQLATFINSPGLSSMGNNLFVETDASGTPSTANPGDNGYGTLAQTFLEGSNVNIVQEVANMITAQRAYEINSKTITTSNQMMQTTNGLIT